MSYTFVSAVNNTAVLESCLLKSPDLISGQNVIVRNNYPSASVAYNSALEQLTEGIVIFVHQDVFLPSDWLKHLETSLKWLEFNDPNWGVLGLCGISSERALHSWIYSTGLRGVVGGTFPCPQQVRTLDEVLLIIRKSSGLNFDDSLLGFHMYGTDICLEAEKRGMRNYAIPCFAIHNTNGIKFLPASFWRGCLYIRKKWRNSLPVFSPCAKVTSSLFPMAMQSLRLWLDFKLRRRSVGSRITNPTVLYQQLEIDGMAQPIKNLTKHE